MGTDRPFFGLRQAPEARLPDSISQIAARDVAAVLAHQPVGPFYLGGYSFGAIVAYEMAFQLLEQGHEVGLLAIIDQRRPGWRLTARNGLPVLHRILAKIPGRIRDEFAQASSTNRFQRIGRLLSSWSKTAVGYRANAVSMFDLNPGETEQILLMDANLRAMRNYKPRPLPVPITLFRANVQLLSHQALDSTLGWSDVAESEVRVRIVPGKHVSIITEPLVRQLAKILSDELDAAQAASRRVETGEP
jgi:thioesterase domain-containing protein